MAFQTEPPHSHGQPGKTALVLCNLGSPKAPTAQAVRLYLAEFLSDPRVVEIAPLLWRPILHGIILRLRPKRSAAKYASIWRPEGSPLVVWTQRQAQLLGQALAAQGHTVTVCAAMRYGEPALGRVLDELHTQGHIRVLVLPAYPQYSGTTTASVFDALAQWGQRVRALPELRFVNRYHDHPAYIDALAQNIRQHWATHGRGEHLVMSFHGVPERTLHLGDPYHCECHKSARLLAQALELTPLEYTVTFQSRFGKAKWLEPYTEPTLVEKARQGLKRVDVCCPGFVSDCLETLEEIQMEVRDAFLGAGGEHFAYIPCLNDHPAWIEALQALALTHLQGWPTQETLDHEPLAQSRQRALAMGAKS